MGKRKDNRWDDIDGGAAFLIPLTLLRHPNYVRLSPWAVKLVMDLARQYSGFNNGYLCASRTLMKECGWKSSHTLQKAVEELEHYGIIVRTRQGGRNRATLHGLSWRRIDHKPGQPLDVGQTLKPDDNWKEERPPFVRSVGKRKPKRRHLRSVA
ncbi:hypothetical protein J2X06_003388 [Lysobacter niastensis]|uniref:Helix-turn-helix domain-containing protein n=1 Tax=Lysobacter niastensis TaxID=380629 RepID=A0ABU1WFH5_9GAMM|nr:hypothetical protein [Lysobacter niastensis]MDR7136170.1 hypothetical protein [Lysobacter niastensis]